MHPSPAARTRIPTPPDLYPAWDTPLDTASPLFPFQEQLILSACPAGARIGAVARAKESRLIGTRRVQIVEPSGEEWDVILRMDPHIDGVTREAALLPTLARFGLPVPTVLAGPAIDPDHPDLGPITILSVLPGDSLLSWVWNAPARDQQRAIEVVLDSVARLRSLTEPLSQDGSTALLPRITLLAELQGVLSRGGPWFEERVFTEAITSIQPAVKAITTPLAFSSGDYNPGNFLWDGQHVTGFIDFSWACFEDPHIGFVKYWTYDWYPLNKAGLVERYLETQQLTAADFALRVAVRCLWTLQREIPVADAVEAPSYAAYRERTLSLLRAALHDLS